MHETDTEMKTYHVEHSRLVVTTYEVQATSEGDAWDLWIDNPQDYEVVKEESYHDLVEVVTR